MRILVTGANGLVGSRLIREIAARGHSAVGLSRGPCRLDSPCEYRSCDLADREAVLAAIGSVRPEAVVHCAAEADVDRCEREPERAFAQNVLATANVALACRAAGAHLVHVSTDYVFDGEDGPYAEDAVPNPKGVYGLTKHMAEQAARALAGSWAIARTAVVYGWPPAARRNFGSWLVESLAARREVRLFEDQIVSPSLAASVAGMLAEIAERRLGGVWHVCGAEALDRVAFGRELCAVFGFDASLLVPVRLDEVKLAGPRPRRCGLRSERARTELVARPLGVRESLEAFKREWEAGRAERW